MSAIRRRAKPDSLAEEDRKLIDGSEKVSSSLGLLRTTHWTLISIFYIALIFATFYLHKCLPTPKDPSPDDSTFSETRARKVLNDLSRFGWKPAGSFECEELARNRIHRELRDIEFTSKAKFDMDLHYVSGCLDIPAHDTDGMNICYKNVSNVIARLSNSDPEGIAVLLNCHYDSWPTSNGGSDDLSSCALMLELIRIYSKHPEMLKHNVIFLFNGAEESSLLAAHGFITQHRWRHQIRAFINLEASGSGGRELLFQAGPSNQWLLNSYLEAAIHPHCSVIGQEVFQSGVYPGDTDFRIFRDHGRIPGLDLAFVQNGYWYHTEFDEAKRITNGSLQRAGENVLATLNHLLASPYLEKPAEYADRKTVFFDFLGLFVVIYPLSLANLINLIAIGLTFLITARRSQQNVSLFLTAVYHYILVCISMLLVIYAMTVMSNFTYGALRWYTRHWLALVAYGIPCLWAGLTVQSLLTARIAPKCRKEYSKCLETIHLSVISAILFVFTYYNIASGFLFALMLIPIFKVLANEFGLLSDCPTLQTVITVITSLPGCAMSIYTTEMLLSVFIPIMGRTPSNPEPIIAAFVAFSAVNIVLSLIGLIARSENSRSQEEAKILDFVYNLSGVLLATLTVLYVFASIWPTPFAYSDEYPTAKRMQFYHVNQNLYDRNGELAVSEARLYAVAQDYRGPEEVPFIRSDSNYTMLQCFYENNPWCEVPYQFPMRKRINQKNMRVRKIDEVYPFPVPIDLHEIRKSRGVDSNGNPTIEYTFGFTGTSQVSVYLIPDKGWKVTDTSVSTPEVPQKTMFLYLTCSAFLNVCEWEFKVTITNTGRGVSEEKPLLVGITAHHLHGPEMQSQTLTNLYNTVKEMRVNHTEWSIAVSAWNVDQVYKYF